MISYCIYLHSHLKLKGELQVGGALNFYSEQLALLQKKMCWS